MRRLALLASTVIVSLGAITASAQAVVVDMNALGQTSVAYNQSDQSGYYGVALVPGSRSALSTAKVPAVTSGAPCLDPALSSDLVLPDAGLCSHGGAVLHSNETFAFTWDPMRRYWATTRGYVEQFLRDVAGASGTLGTPYADTSQYTDTGGRAGNSSAYGGGCIDYGAVGGASCQFTSTTGTQAGHDYPASDCPYTSAGPCLTDAQLQDEVRTMVTQTGVIGHTRPGYSPLIVLLTPSGVQTCLDSGGTLCSVGSGAAAQFCSYHGQVDVGGTLVPYVVQPWSAQTHCDEPDAPPIPINPPADVLAKDIGARLVSPLSQAEMGAITDPRLNGWFALDGSEINDNYGCTPLGNGLDVLTIGGNGYLLQREFNNAGVIESDPNAQACTPSVALAPTFVVPSAVNIGDEVQFDGSTTASTLMVPRADYAWSFGDGTGGIGPSVVHSYGAGGNYTVTLTVTDRGGNVARLSQTISVLGASGQPPVAPIHASAGLRIHLQLMPQSLRSVLRRGVFVRVSANESAAGIARISISRAAARRAHLSSGRGGPVVIGRGTVSGLRDGTINLHLRLSRAVTRKLKRLRHVTLTIRLSLVGSDRGRVAVDAAGRY